VPRSQGPFNAPPLPSGALEFHRDYDFQGTTDPRDLARALRQEQSHDWIAATKVLSPDEPQ
jgi:hypothetical protein